MLSARRKYVRGFNLIEVMMVVTVLAVLLGVGVPSVAEWIRNTHVRNLAETLQNGLQKARNEALRRNRVVTFWLVSPAAGIPDATCALSSASGSWVISQDNPATLCHVAASDTVAPRIVEVHGTGSNGAGITVAAVDRNDTAAASVSFNGMGMPASAGMPISRIDVTHTQTGARQLRIQISAGGGIRMCDLAVAAPDPRACN